MNERAITTEVLKHLRGHLHGSEVLKHADFGMKGMPDVSVGLLDRINYVELKYKRKRDSLKGINDPVQLSLCHRLGAVHKERSWVVIYEEEPYQVTVWKPRALFTRLWPRVAGPATEWRVTETEPLVLGQADFNKADYKTLLTVYGGITLNDWSYAIPTQLILNALR